MYVLEAKAEIIDKYWYYSIKRIMLIIINDIDFIDKFTNKRYNKLIGYNKFLYEFLYKFVINICHKLLHKHYYK